MRPIAVLLALVGAAQAGDLFDDVERAAAELRSPEPARRREAVDRLDAYKPNEVRGPLLEALGDADLEVRVRAAAALGRHKLVDAAPRLILLLGDPEPRLRAAAAGALGQLGALLDGATTERTARALERTLGDAEHEVRQAAVGALGQLPPQAARPLAVSLAGRLDDDHPGVRQRASEVLGRLGDARAVIPLIGRLGDGSREVRMAGLESLAQLGDPRAAPAMIRLLTDPADEVRSLAVQSLGRLRAKAAIVPLVAVLERGAESLRGRAAVALGQIATASGGEAAIAPLVAALARDDLRHAAREALRLAGTQAVPPLVARMPTAGDEELGAIVDLLGELRDPRARVALHDELERGRLARERVVDALGQLVRASEGSRAAPGNPGLVDLVALLSDGEAGVRRRAALALRGVADARAVSALAEALRDSDREVRLVAVAELGRLKARQAVPPLQVALAGPDEETAALAARALGEIGDSRAGPSLEQALGRAERRIRREAADALGRTREAALIPALLKRVRGADAERRPEAICALGGQLRGRTDAVARELLLGIAEGHDAISALEAVDALAAARDKDAAPRLARLLSTKDSSLRRRVVQALGELEGAVDAGLLIGRLEDDLDPRVRAEAAWALGKSARAATGLVAALERALGSPVAAIRGNAAAALFRLGHAPASLERLTRDVDPAVRANAQLALKRAHKPAPRADWIGLHLVDFDGAPLADARYRLLCPDGLVKSGWADSRGQVREESLPSGGVRLEVVDEPPGKS